MIEIRDITKSYKTGDFVQKALDGVSITFRESEFVAVLGPSGSGKTTFLNILGGFDHADSGDIVVNGVSTKNYSDKDWDTYRNHRIGFIFQSYNLIPHQTVVANVELALTLAGIGGAERHERAMAALERVGLAEHANKKPAQLSGGQMQRVAIARALVNDPEIVLADEPTGALDTETGIQVMNLLAEVAQERLVIMVTHNPQLAEDYATRIVNIKDGKIVDDSRPVTADEFAANTAKDEGKKKRSGMGLLTALSLSANNLMTKKGRTILTAFAGSIGIIGIAAILALSNGVNNYIAKVEQDTLSSYPLTISKQSYDLTSMLTGGSGGDEADGEGENSSDGGKSSGSDTKQASTKKDGNQKISVMTMLQDMFASVKSNDMTSFKEWLDDGGDGIEDDVSAIQYNYGIEPMIYSSNTQDGLTQLAPNAMTGIYAAGASSAATSSMMMSSNSAFNEMIDDSELLGEQYDVLAGKWATEANEAVLVLSSTGKISDYTLYSIGVLDPEEMNDLVKNTMAANTEDVVVPENNVNFTYNDALSTSFKVLSPSDAYRKNAETGGWTDMSEDADFMKSQVEKGLDLKIVGVVKPKETANSTALTQGVAYTHKLTTALMERAANSEIVKQQLADQDTDVFTGKSFEALQDEAKSGVDLSSLFSVDQNVLASAFKMDSSALENLDLSSLGLSGGSLEGMDLSNLNLDFSNMNLDLSGMNLDLSGVGEGIDMQSLFADAPTPDFSTMFEDVDADLGLSENETSELASLSAELLRGFMQYLQQNGSVDLSDPTLSDQLQALMTEYLQSDDAQAILEQVQDIAGEPVANKLSQVMQNYVSKQFAPYMQSASQELMSQLSAQIQDTLSSQMQTAMQGVMSQVMEQVTSQIQTAMEGAMDQYATQMTQGMETLQAQLQDALQDAVSFDPSVFANAISFNMDAEDLTSLMTSYANANSLTYDNNLSTLGYASEADPQSVKLYPRDFEGKERVLACIDKYNARMEAAGQEDKAISYTDYVGVLMGSVTDIINMISLVLIAFVSISLVVSSIMIGIITYISVLERKKEIGILRAMGASKLNIANVFNAETFIEGLISGVLAIAVVVIVSFPVNAWVLRDYNVENVMSLPVTAALALIGISVLLTVVAGLLPSTGAARRDPVEALRSE